MADDKKFIVPIFVIAYGDSPDDAVEYVEKALDNTWFVGEDGIYSAEVLNDETEEYFEEDF